MPAMLFIESPVFTNSVKELLSDDDYAALQAHLARYPEAGVVISHTGGLRKIRWGTAQTGKRGGVRVIYYHVTTLEQIRLILIYRKGIKDDLSPAEKKILRSLNAKW